MGAWGTGIFQGDTACDIRDLYIELASLGLNENAINDELGRAFGHTDGVDGSNFLLALALTQHRLGRLGDETKSRALAVIDTGQALADWTELTEPGDPSIRGRAKQLAKAQEKLVSPQPKQKRLKPSPELMARIDRIYVDYPWRKGGLYAWRSSIGDWVVLAAIETGQLTLPQQYVSTAHGYALVSRPKLTQAILLLLDSRGEIKPTGAQAQRLRPFLRPFTQAERNSALKGIEGSRAVWAKGASRSFEDFRHETRDMLAHFTEEQLRERYAVSTKHSVRELARFADPEAAADRHFHLRFKIDPRDSPPADRLIDLGVDATFESEPPRDTWTWGELDAELEKLRR